MEEKELQLEGNEHASEENEELSDDDVAATLGLITSLSEQKMNPMEPTDMQEENPEDEREQKTEEEVPGGNIDAEQQKEIDEIRAELESLKNDTASETTTNLPAA